MSNWRIRRRNSEIVWYLGRNVWVGDYRAKCARIIQNTRELVGLETLQITLCKYRNPCSAICRFSARIKKHHNYEMWVQTGNQNLVNTSVWFLLKKQVTKLYQRPMCLDVSTSNSYERKSFKRLVFASTQISTRIRTPNDALCIVSCFTFPLLWKKRPKFSTEKSPSLCLFSRNLLYPLVNVTDFSFISLTQILILRL